MRKCVYLKVCDFNEPTYFHEDKTYEGYYDAKITFANDLIVTSNHHSVENFEGETVLVIKNNVLYAKFEGVNDRLYRYVKQRKFRHCSYSSRTKNYNHVSILENGEKLKLMRDLHVFEICVTNSPRNEETFVTVDDQHEAFKGIDWRENVNRVDSASVEEMKLSQGFKDLEESFKATDKLLNKTIKKIEKRNSKWVN